jgi:hypothetical protein
MTCLSRFDQQKGCFVLKATKPLKPANAFEWRRYVQEEQERRGKESLAKLSGTARTRSIATTKAIERIRQTQPTFGTMHGMSSKTERMLALKPKTFIIYSKAQSASRGKGTL